MFCLQNQREWERLLNAMTSCCLCGQNAWQKINCFSWFRFCSFSNKIATRKTKRERERARDCARNSLYFCFLQNNNNQRVLRFALRENRNTSNSRYISRNLIILFFKLFACSRCLRRRRRRNKKNIWVAYFVFRFSSFSIALLVHLIINILLVYNKKII